MIYRLSNERVRRTYLGGKLIDELHGRLGEDSYFPEEWIMSVTTANGSETEGLTRISDGRTLRELIADNPEELLGAAHYARFGASTGVLAKLLDSSERLTIQVHPDRDKAMKYFGSPYGKTESWHILATRDESACIYLGFREGVTREYWRELFERQRLEDMLDCLNRVYVKPGETYLVKAGEPHTIGMGCLLAEVQEPTDFTLRTELTTPSGLKIGEKQAHGGIGYDAMLDCFHYSPTLPSDCRLKARNYGHETVLISSADTPCFGLTRIEVDSDCRLADCEAFCGLYILSGNGSLNGEPICAGMQFFIPAGERLTFQGESLIALRILPPESAVLP